jgi:sugar lactone lactonase YvrE
MPPAAENHRAPVRSTLPRVTRAEQFTDPVAFHAEGPVWSPSWGGLRWVDMFAGDVLSFNADGGIGREHVGTIAAALRPRLRGGTIIAVERGFLLDDGDASTRRPLPEVFVDPTVRMNEGGCDPDGRFYCGSMGYDKAAGRGQLYRLDADGSTSVVLTGVTISNGLEWSPDGTTAYYNDTPTRRIDAFDYDRDNGLTGRRPFVEIPEGAGFPDGLTVDAEGGVWVALYAGSAVHRYRPDGVLDDVVELPVSHITACTFGGDDLGDLFVTTSREDVPDGEQPAAGSLVHCRPGVFGRPVRPFAG